MRNEVGSDGGLPVASATERQRSRDQMLADGDARPPLALFAVQQRPEANDQPPAAGGDLPLPRRELGSQQGHELGLGAVKGEQRLGAEPSSLVWLRGVLAAVFEGTGEGIGGDVEGGLQAVGYVVEVAIEGTRGDTGAAGDPLRGGAEVAAFVEDLGGPAKQAPALVFGDRGGRKAVTAPRQPLSCEADPQLSPWPCRAG